MKPTDLILYRQPSLQVMLPLGGLARQTQALDEKMRGEVVAVLARLLIEAASASSVEEADDDA